MDIKVPLGYISKCILSVPLDGSNVFISYYQAVPRSIHRKTLQQRHQCESLEWPTQPWLGDALVEVSRETKRGWQGKNFRWKQQMRWENQSDSSWGRLTWAGVFSTSYSQGRPGRPGRLWLRKSQFWTWLAQSKVFILIWFWTGVGEDERRGGVVCQLLVSPWSRTQLGCWTYRQCTRDWKSRRGREV